MLVLGTAGLIILQMVMLRQDRSLAATLLRILMILELLQYSNGHGLNYGHYGGAIHKSSSSSTSKNYTQPKYKQIARIKSWMESSVKPGVGRIIQETKKCISTPPPLNFLRSLYWISAADGIRCIITNDYSSRIHFRRSGGKKTGSMPSMIIRFTGVRPRLLYSVGSLLRAFQLCTPLKLVFDPAIGVGAGVNISAMIARSRWVSPLILGWATTKWAWTWLGARSPERVHVPIVLSMRER